MQRIRGTVIWWKEDRGYGFIRGDDNESYFIHFKDILEQGRRNLYRGQRVNFFSKETEKGKCAVKLHYAKAMKRLNF